MRPARRGVSQVRVDHRDGLSEAVLTGPLTSLDLDQLKQFRALIRGSHEMQFAAGIGQQETGRRRADQPRRAGRDYLQELDQVELHSQGVGELHERLGNPLRIQRFRRPLPSPAPRSPLIHLRVSLRETMSRATAPTVRP